MNKSVLALAIIFLLSCSGLQVARTGIILDGASSVYGVTQTDLVEVGPLRNTPGDGLLGFIIVDTIC